MSDTELEEREQSAGAHDDLGVPKEHAEAEAEELEKAFADDSIKEPDGGLYKGGQAPKPSNGKLKKRLLAGGGIAGIGIVTAVISFFALLPLKLVHIVENLQGHFFSASDSALNNYTDSIFSNYVKRHLIPGMRGTCTAAKVDAQCIATDSTSPIDRLYRGWKDNKIETKLATDYGLVFEKNGTNGSISIRLPGEGLPLSLDGFENQDKNLFDFIKEKNPDKTKLTTNEVRQKIRDALQGETKLKQTIYRIRFDRYMKRKYGVKLCVAKCETRDGLTDKWTNGKLAFKATLVNRVVIPHSEFAGIILNCIIGASNCEPSTSVNADGRGNSAEEQQINSKVDDLFRKLGIQTTKDAEKAASEIADQGFQKWAVAKLLTQMGISNAEDIVSDTADGIGWVSKIVSILTVMQKAGPVIKRLSYVSSSVAMVQLWMTYRSHVDEIKGGNVSPEVVGSFTQAMDGIHLNDAGSAYAPNGGVQNAENSPLYKYLIDDSSTTNAPLTLKSFFNQTAYAQSTNQHNSNYTCDNNQPIPSGQLVCPEEKVSQDNPFTGLSDFFSSGVVGFATDLILTLWNGTVGAILKGIQNASGAAFDFALNAPGARDAVDKLITPLTKLVTPIMESLLEFVVPSPISTDMSGARDFNMVAGGADVAGNDYSHYSLGGKQLTPQQSADILNQQTQDQQTQFAMKPFTQRMFDKNDSKSLVSQVAMAIPLNMGDSIHSFFADLVSNPFSKIAGTFGSLFNVGRVHAQVAAMADPFGVTQFGYPVNDPVLTQDPTAYTDQQCTDMNTAWLANEKPNDSGQFTNDQTNPCLLQKAAVEGLGALIDSSLVDPADR